MLAQVTHGAMIARFPASPASWQAPQAAEVVAAVADEEASSEEMKKGRVVASRALTNKDGIAVLMDRLEKADQEYIEENGLLFTYRYNLQRYDMHVTKRAAHFMGGFLELDPTANHVKGPFIAGLEPLAKTNKAILKNQIALVQAADFYQLFMDLKNIKGNVTTREGTPIFVCRLLDMLAQDPAGAEKKPKALEDAQHLDDLLETSDSTKGKRPEDREGASAEGTPRERRMLVRHDTSPASVECPLSPMLLAPTGRGSFYWDYGRNTGMWISTADVTKPADEVLEDDGFIVRIWHLQGCEIVKWNLEIPITHFLQCQPNVEETKQDSPRKKPACKAACIKIKPTVKDFPVDKEIAAVLDPEVAIAIADETGKRAASPALNCGHHHVHSRIYVHFEEVVMKYGFDKSLIKGYTRPVCARVWNGDDVGGVL